LAVDHLEQSRCEPGTQPTASQLRQLAQTALDQQGITVKRLRWMGRHTNHLFRCDATTGDRLVVRVCLPDGRSDAELDAELTWLGALARDTGLTVPVARFSTRAATPELRPAHAASHSPGSRAASADAGPPGGWSPTSAGSSPRCTATPRDSVRRPASPARPWTSST
jgi:hypothetical protein